jgi:hypothetical protein
MSWLLARLREPSTWAGLGAVCSAAVSLFPSAAVGAAVCGAIAVALTEKGSKDANPS